MKKNVKVGLLSTATLAAVAAGSLFVSAVTTTNGTTVTDTQTGPTTAGVYTGTMKLTVPEVVRVNLGSAVSPTTLNPVLTYSNGKMDTETGGVAGDGSGTKTLPEAPGKHEPIYNLSSLDPNNVLNTAKAGAYGVTLTGNAAGGSGDQTVAATNLPNTTVNSVVIVESSTTTTDVSTGATSKTVNGVAQNVTALLTLTTPKTIVIPVGSATDSSTLLKAINPALTYGNDVMGTKILPEGPGKHEPIYTLSGAVDSSKAGTYTVKLTATAAGGSGDQTIPGTKVTPVSNTISVVVGKAAPTPTQPVPAVAVYRLYNKNTGEHFYTTSLYEANADVKAGWKSENVGFNAPKTGTAVYRIYNPNSGLHLYTTSSYEYGQLAKAGWRKEGIAFYSDTTKGIPVYRVYNPNAGEHVYTESAYEASQLVKIGWKSEGIAWYASREKVATPTLPSTPSTPSTPTAPDQTQSDVMTGATAGGSQAKIETTVVNPINVKLGSTWNTTVALSKLKAAFYDADVSGDSVATASYVTVSGTVNTAKAGQYPITYNINVNGFKTTVKSVVVVK